jgi:eukaryotic-like serine/threonine-protein kinase
MNPLRDVSTAEANTPPLVIERYAIYDAIASGGMATVHLGRFLGPAGFSRTVAIKRLHPHFASDPLFTEMFLDEARMAARVHHPNVVPTLDVIQTENELLLVMEYVRGDSLGKLIRAANVEKTRIHPRTCVSIISGALQGLHAAHEAIDEKGHALGLVHRDMSPQNIIVGVDGTARVLDFGIAKAEGRMQNTAEGVVKGKLLYMPPEQLSALNVTRAADIYSIGIVLFELLTGVRMFAGDHEGVAIARILRNDVRLPSSVDAALYPFDDVVRCATAFEPTQRFATAREMSLALEHCLQPAPASDVGAWVEHLAFTMLNDRAKRVAEIESSTSRSMISKAVTTAPFDEKKSQTQRLAFVLAALLLLSLVAVAYLVGTRTRPNETPTASQLVAKETPAPSGSVSTSPERTATLSPGPSAIVKFTSTVKVQPVIAKPKPGCTPPYTIDKNGHRHFIPECIQ